MTMKRNRAKYQAIKTKRAAMACSITPKVEGEVMSDQGASIFGRWSRSKRGFSVRKSSENIECRIPFQPPGGTSWRRLGSPSG
jgi:hypothetical protein